MTLIPPYDHRDIIAGQGTVGLEIVEDLPDVDVVAGPGRRRRALLRRLDRGQGADARRRP